MADSEKIFRLKLEVAEAQANANVKKLQKSLEKLDGRTKEYTLTLGKLKLERAKLNQLRSQAVASNEQLSSSMNKSASATGASTAASLELGRVFSDMPYGIRGVANNISQLASNVFFMSKKTDEVTGKVVGFGGAIKNIGTSLLGPAGVLVAFQLVVAIFEKLSMSSKKLKDNLAALQAESFTENVVKLHLLRQAVNDTSISMEEKAKAVKAAATEFKELNETIEEGSVNIAKFNSATDELIDEMKRVAFANAVLSETKDVMQEAVREIAQGPEGAFDSLEGFGYAIVDVIQGFEQGTTSFIEHGGNLSELAKKYDKLFEILKTGNLFDELFGKTTTTNKRLKDFKSGLLDLSKLILDANRREETLLEEGEFKKLEITQKYEIQDLDRRRDTFIKKQEQRLEDFKKSTDNAEKIAEAEETFRLMKEQATEEHGRALTAITAKHTKERQKLERDLEREHQELLITQKDNILLNEIRTEEMKTLNMLSRLEIEKEALDTKLQQDINRINREIEERKRQEKEYEDLEFKKANVIEKYSQDAIKNENLVAENKLRVLDYVSNAMSAFSRLAGRETEAGKALAIAAATIDTYVGANKALTDETIPNTFARIAAVASVIATGLANVRAIAATKVRGASGGGDTGAGSGRTFDFNLVGSTGQDQLAQAVGGQLNQGPIQSYVVSSQITSQQQLDNIIESDATFGGDN